MKSFFKLIAFFNKKLLPSYTKDRLDLNNATKFQLLILWWKAFVTLRSLD